MNKKFDFKLWLECWTISFSMSALAVLPASTVGQSSYTPLHPEHNSNFYNSYRPTAPHGHCRDWLQSIIIIIMHFHFFLLGFVLYLKTQGCFHSRLLPLQDFVFSLVLLSCPAALLWQAHVRVWMHCPWEGHALTSSCESPGPFRSRFWILSSTSNLIMSVWKDLFHF